MSLRVFFISAVALGLSAAAAAPAPSATTAAAPKATPAPTPISIQAGEQVVPFELVGIDGVLHRVDFPKGQVTVLLFFNSGCPHCHRMIPVWNEAFQRRPRNLAVIGIVTDPAPLEFFQEMTILFPVLRSPGREFTDRLKVPTVPYTIRVRPGGTIDDVAAGELDPIRIGQLFRP